MAYLTFRRGQGNLFIHPLRPGRRLIGRSDRCDIALPSSDVSRRHCLVEKQLDAWWVYDRSSKHGTYVNGDRVSHHRLEDGDVITIGDFTASFSSGTMPRSREITAPNLGLGPKAEDFVSIDGEDVEISRAELLFTDGPKSGQTVVLCQKRVNLGGPGAHVVLDDKLPRHAARLRVVRDRVMVESDQVLILLQGKAVRELTPVFPKEQLRLGDNVFEVRTRSDTRRLTYRGNAFGDLIGGSPVMQQVFAKLALYAQHHIQVLLIGETGTGKELAAQAIHQNSAMADGPFVAVNCAAIPDTLLEAELFGYERGAFTGAETRKEGVFHQADGGTLLLDEIGELSLRAQAKLLRTLETQEVRRVGGVQVEYPKVRIIAATNQDLRRKEKEFRRDLYYRLSRAVVHMPPLRTHPEDIPLITGNLLRRIGATPQVSQDVLAMLKAHSWPGNVRELENVVRRAHIFALGSPISRKHIEFDEDSMPMSVDAAPTQEDPERLRIIEALHVCKGNKTAAALRLGMSRTTLGRRMERLGIALSGGS